MSTRQPTARASVTDVLLGVLLAAAGLVLLGGFYLRVFPSLAALSAFALLAGLLGIGGALIGRTSPGFLTEIVSGALVGVLGVFMVRFPDTPVPTVQLLAGAFFAVNGIVRLASVTEFPALRPVLLSSGAISLAMGGAVFWGAVAPTLVMLGVLVGAELVVDGLTAVLVGRRGRAGAR